MIGRIVRSADFERVLGAPSRARSSHFAVHHLAAKPSQPKKPLSTADRQLSTGDAQLTHKLVDDSVAAVAVEGCWLGYVVPKRHAKRSVTRALFKRLIRAAFAASTADGQALPPGLWVVRLRAPFDRKLFPSAASDALRAAVRAELAQLRSRVLVRSPATPN